MDTGADETATDEEGVAAAAAAVASDDDDEAGDINKNDNDDVRKGASEGGVENRDGSRNQTGTYIQKISRCFECFELKKMGHFLSEGDLEDMLLRPIFSAAQPPPPGSA